jgi:hypothetical protein
MGAFDHIILLLSFVYALAIGHLLTTAALLLRRRREVRFSSLHAFWMLNALVAIIANWISFWDLRGLPSWSVWTIFFTFLIAFSNYLQAALVSPEIRAEGAVDLVAFQAEHRLEIVGSWFVLAVIALAANVVYGHVFGVITWDEQNLAVIPMVISGAMALIWRARWAQIGAAVIVAASWMLYFGALQGAIH